MSQINSMSLVNQLTLSSTTSKGVNLTKTSVNKSPRQHSHPMHSPQSPFSQKIAIPHNNHDAAANRTLMSVLVTNKAYNILKPPHHNGTTTQSSSLVLPTLQSVVNHVASVKQFSGSIKTPPLQSNHSNISAQSPLL